MKKVNKDKNLEAKIKRTRTYASKTYQILATPKKQATSTNEENIKPSWNMNKKL